MTTTSRRSFLTLTTLMLSTGPFLQPGTDDSEFAAALGQAENLLAQSLPAAALSFLLGLPRPADHVDPALTVRYLSYLGVSHRDTGRPDTGRRIFDRIREHARHTRNQRLYATTTIESVICLMNADRWGAARSRLISNRDVLSLKNDHRFDVETKFWVARTLESSGDVYEAWELSHNEILPESRVLESASMQVARHSFACRLALDQDDPDWASAERSLETAAGLVNADTSILRKGQLLTAQAHYAFRRRQVDDALHRLEEARTVFSRGGIISPHHMRLSRQVDRYVTTRGDGIRPRSTHRDRNRLGYLSGSPK